MKPSPFHPTAHLSWFDLYAGIPTMIIAIATVPFSLFFWYAYPVKPYYLENVNRNVPIAHHHHHHQHEMDPDLEAHGHPLISNNAVGAGRGPHSNSDDDDVTNHAAKFSRRGAADQDHTPAIISTAGSSYQGGFLGYRAWVGMFNPSELLSGFVFGFTMLSNKRNREMGAETVRRTAQTGEYGRY